MLIFKKTDFGKPRKPVYEDFHSTLITARSIKTVRIFLDCVSFPPKPQPVVYMLSPSIHVVKMLKCDFILIVGISNL